MDRKIRNIISLFKGLAWGFAVCALLSLCSSCRTKYVAVPEYHETYVSHTDTLMQRDSIYMRDSVYVMTKGDTVFVSKWQTKYVDKVKYNTIVKDSVRTDTVTKVVTETVTKESHGGWIAFVGLLVALVCGIVFVKNSRQ